VKTTSSGQLFGNRRSQGRGKTKRERGQTNHELHFVVIRVLGRGKGEGWCKRLEVIFVECETLDEVLGERGVDEKRGGQRILHTYETPLDRTLEERGRGKKDKKLLFACAEHGG